MMIALHKLARTTPAVRAEIAASRESVAALARRYNVTGATIRKWRATTSTACAKGQVLQKTPSSPCCTFVQPHLSVHVQPVQPIGVRKVDVLPTVSARGDVTRAAGEFDSQWA